LLGELAGGFEAEPAIGSGDEGEFFLWRHLFLLGE
jgi:hypothetical protein